MSELPDGWVETTFEEVADIQLGKMLDKNKNVGAPVPYLRNINVRWGGFDLGDIFSMKMSRDERQKYSIKFGDLMVCEGGEPGRAAVWREQECQFAFQKALMRVRSNGAVMPDWMYALLFYASASGDLSERFTGTTIKHLPQRALASAPIPLPPLAEQKRIVEKLDALSAQSRTATTALTRIETLITRYKAAVLEYAYLGGLTSKWRKDMGREPNPMVEMEACFLRLRTGPFGSALHKSDYIDGGIPIVNPKHLVEGRIVEEQDKSISDSKAKELSEFILATDDIVVGRRGEMGRCAVVGQREAGFILGTGSMAVTPASNVDPEFLAYIISSPPVVRALTANSVGTTMINLNQSILKSIELPLPPLEEQAEIVARIQAAFAQIETLARAAAAARGRLGALDRSILARAFKGNLVPQNPNDEPASELLKRVKENAG